MHDFPCPEPVTVTGRLAAGTMEVIAEARDTATVEIIPADGSDSSRDAATQTRVEMLPGRLVVEAPEIGLGWLLRRTPKLRITIRVPRGCDLELKTVSADLKGLGQFGRGTLTTASGDVQFQQSTGDVTVQTASGDARVEDVGGVLTVNSASGDVSIGQIGQEATVRTASGDVTIASAATSVRAVTASGDVRVGSVRHGQLTVSTASGDVAIGVERGTGVWLDLSTLSGDTRNELTMGGDAGGGTPGEVALTLSVRTVSGDIKLHRVGAHTPA